MAKALLSQSKKGLPGFLLNYLVISTESASEVPMHFYVLLSLLLSSCAFSPPSRGPAAEPVKKDCGVRPEWGLPERIRDCDEVLRDHAKEPLARWVMRDQGREFIYDVIHKTLWGPVGESEVSLEEAKRACSDLNQTLSSLQMKWKIASKEDYLRAFDKWYEPRSLAQKIAYPDERAARVFPHLIKIKDQKYFWTNTRVKVKIPGSSDYQFVMDQRESYITPMRRSLSDRYFKKAFYRCVAKHPEDSDPSDQEN